MFGFGRKPDHFNELLEYLIDSWQMKTRYAAAFLTEYRADISTLHSQGMKRLEKAIDLSKPENRLLAYQMPDPRDYALVGQAYKAYIYDLRRGKNVGTDVEMAIWAILCNRSDLLETIDAPLSNYVSHNQSSKFPTLFEDVFAEVDV